MMDRKFLKEEIVTEARLVGKKSNEPNEMG